MAVAVHEAGHALTATQLKIRIGKAQIHANRDGSTQGAVTISGTDCDEDPHAYGLVLVAGIQAAALWLQRVHGYDIRKAQSWADQSGDNDLGTFRRLVGVGSLRAARLEVTPLLMRHYGRLIRGAGMLHARRSMAATRVLRGGPVTVVTVGRYGAGGGCEVARFVTRNGP